MKDHNNRENIEKISRWKRFSIFTEKPSGISIIEILAVLAISSVVLIGGLRVLTISTRTSQVVGTSFSEQDLRVALGNVLGSSEQCKINLKPAASGINDMGIGAVNQMTNVGETILQTGGFFKKNLEIIKMELKSKAIPPLDPKTQDVTRTFMVYYKKRIVGKQATLGGGDCTSTNLDGCYFSQCRVVYKLNTAGTSVEGCDMLDCTGGQESVGCYTVDETEATNASLVGDTGAGRTLIGCGGTSQIERSAITAFGFGAGASNDPNGVMNTYIGYKAGASNTEYSDNTIIGYEAGINMGATRTIGVSHGRNVFIGTQAGYKATKESDSTFVGSKAGYETTEGHRNVFLGTEAGRGNTKGGKNVYIGYQAGYSYNDIADEPLVLTSSPDADKSRENTFIGYQAGKNNTKGQMNTFIGYQAGKSNTGGYSNIYIGRGAATGAGITNAGYRQLNIGNLILGRITNSGLTGSPNIPNTNDPGVVINGDLMVRGSISYDCAPTCDPAKTFSGTPGSISPTMYAFNPISSKEYKKNIKPFKDYEKALKDIVNTPLFTYEYKKDRPEKSRMGIISEELPKHLQLREKLDPRFRGDDSVRENNNVGRKKNSNWKGFSKKKNKKVEEVSMPDWPSIYGTFWAGIKALFIQFKRFKEKMFAELKQLKEQFTNALKLAEGNKKTIEELNALLGDASKVHQKESDKRNKELAELKKLLKETTEELEAAQKEMQEIKKLIKKQK